MKKKIGYFATAVLGVMWFGMSHVSASGVTDTDFESGSLAGWENGSQTGTLTNGTISQSGTGVSLVNGSVTFNAPAHPASGSPTLGDGSPNPYYAPAVTATTWTFAPYGSYAAALQPNTSVTFDQATAALGLSAGDNTALKTMMNQQAAASGFGAGNPTDAAWITKTVNLTAGITYTMSWNYIGTDYVPFNDGSITSLVYEGSGSSTVTVNNGVGNYALLGFTNPGTGDYSTGTFGSTGWQMSTYQVSVTGQYRLGFAVFNLDDMGLSPVLLIDSQPGSTQKNGEQFGAVPPNNSNAPVVTTAPATTPAPTTEPVTTTPAPTTTEPAPTTTEPATTTVPVPEVTDPVVTEPAPVGTEPVIPIVPPQSLPNTGSRLGGLVGFAAMFALVGMFVLGVRGRDGERL